MAAFFISSDAALGCGVASRPARQPTIEFAALFARLWDGTLQIVLFLWALVVLALFGLIAVGFWFA
jgi:hypothetical protein